ncbi:hypothetical protein AX14_010502 [Amanita brunnescens Koide BX004]|nr:hypothetical protein AX14_010502 [Amanita brunnescens Koide BX004]
MPVVPPGATHDIMIMGQLAHAYAPRSRSLSVTKRNEAYAWQARSEQPNTTGIPGQCEANIVKKDNRVSAVEHSHMSGAAYMPPNPLHLTLLWLVVALSTLVVAPGATHDIVGRLVNTNAPRSRFYLVVCQSGEPAWRGTELPDAMDVSRQCGVSIVNKDIYVNAILHSLLSRVALMPPICLPVALLEVGSVALSMPAVPLGAAHDIVIVGRLANANAPRSRAFPVIFQSADASR